VGDDLGRFEHRIHQFILVGEPGAPYFGRSPDWSGDASDPMPSSNGNVHSEIDGQHAVLLAFDGHIPCARESEFLLVCGSLLVAGSRTRFANLLAQQCRDRIALLNSCRMMRPYNGERNSTRDCTTAHECVMCDASLQTGIMDQPEREFSTSLGMSFTRMSWYKVFRSMQRSNSHSE
jgi:hypothetical protein